MKRLSVPEFAKVLEENPNTELSVAGYCWSDEEEFTSDDCEAWFAFMLTSIADCKILVANYCGSEDPYSLRVYPVEGYEENETGIVYDLEHAIRTYMEEMDEFDHDELVYFDDEDM